MNKIIEESGAAFGPIQEDDLFYIEKSQLYNSLGSGLKTVEFIFLKNKGNSVIFLEAKKTCPNENNRMKSKEKEEKFELYFAEISQKVVDSINIFMAAILGRYSHKDELGKNFYQNLHMQSAKLKFVLVITSPDAKKDWLPGPKAELERRLLQLRKIWNLDIVVINREIAQKKGLIS